MMRKEEVTTLLVYAVMIGIAIYVGVNLIAPAFVKLAITGLSQYVYAIITIFGAFLINVILLELSHVLGALAAGYRINTVNILGLALVRTNLGFQLRFQPYEGLTGETIVTPKAKKLHPRLWLLSGLYGYLLLIVVALFIGYGLFNDEQWGRYASVVVIAVGGMLMIYNFVPFKLDTVNDGYRLATLSTPKGNATYEELQRIEAAYKKGEDPKPFKIFKELNHLSLQVYFHKIYQAIVDGDYPEAKKDLKTIAKAPRMTEVIQQKIAMLETYLYFLQAKGKTASTYYYNLSSKQRKYLSHDANMTTLSAYLYVAGIIEDSYSEATYTFERQRIAIKKINESGRKAAEAIMFNRVLKLVKKKHPTWRF